MAEEEPAQVSDDPLAALRAAAPWLGSPGLGVCVVGSHALAMACARAGVPGPAPADLDLSWALEPAAGEALLRQHGVFVPTTEGNVGRGTLAMKLAGGRIEITAFRAGQAGSPLPERIAADLRARDMTIGALAVELATGTIHDPTGGLDHWRQRRIVPVGDCAERVREHPVRWVRYYRKAHQFGFQLDRSVRALDLPRGILRDLPPEAIALELRAALLKCASPGRFLLELHEVGLLGVFAPELALQCDGRPAGPQRHHPEVSQALHLVLALEWAVERTTHLDERDRCAVLLAVLCHDLGQGFTRPRDLPRHIGHEHYGLPHVDALLRRLPGLADNRTRTLCRDVCALHLEVRRLHEVRAGTLARLYDEHFRARDYPVELFALAVAADSGGRLGLAASGEAMLPRLVAQLHWLRRAAERVDAAALRAQHPEVAAFRTALHEARSRAIAAALHEPDAPRADGSGQQG